MNSAQTHRWLFAVCLLISLWPLSMRAQLRQTIVIYFPSNRAYLTTGAASIIHRAMAHDTLRRIDSVKIYAYCDAEGSVAYNDTLAAKRAETVKQFLLNHYTGLRQLRSVVGYGKRMPLNSNATDSLKALNRRAEIWIWAHSYTAADSFRNSLAVAKPGDKLRLPNINFIGGQHHIIPESKPTLNLLLKTLKEYPQMEIEILGYVCCTIVGTDGWDYGAKNGQLSKNRARAVYDYLVANGIAATRLSYKGLGNIPLVEEKTEEDTQINRRVEIRIVKR